MSNNGACGIYIFSKAREVSLAVCSDNASYDERVVCFEKSIELINHPAINIVAAGCKGISNGYYKSECYEDALSSKEEGDLYFNSKVSGPFLIYLRLIRKSKS